jgi:hypothetical protein
MDTNMDTSPVSRERGWELIAAFIFGCVFLVVILVIALFRPSPTPFEYTVFRIIIALAAAGVGAILPGFLDVRFKNWLRAGGALALFVVVYFFAPAAMPVSDSPSLGPGPKTAAKQKAEEWLSLVDQNNFKNAYMQMADGFRARYPFSQFEELITRERNSVGAVKTRQFMSTAPFESPPGVPKGIYRQYQYKTSFDKEPAAIYEFVWLAAESQDWRVSGFFNMIKTETGQFVPYEPK